MGREEWGRVPVTDRGPDFQVGDLDTPLLGSSWDSGWGAITWLQDRRTGTQEDSEPREARPGVIQPRLTYDQAEFGPHCPGCHPDPTRAEAAKAAACSVGKKGGRAEPGESSRAPRPASGAVCLCPLPVGQTQV